MGLELYLAIKYLLSKKNNKFISVVSFLSFFGVVLGVAILVVVMSVMSGFRSELIERILGVNAHLVISPFANSIKNYEEQVQDLNDMLSIKSAVPVVQGQAMIMSSNKGQGLLLKGMNLEDFHQREVFDGSIVAGDLSEFNEDFTIVLGKVLARELGVSVGDFVTLLSPEKDSTIFGSIPRLKDFKVIAVFDVGMNEYNSVLGFSNLNSAQRYFSYKKSVSVIEVMAYSAEDYNDVYLQINDYIDEKKLTQYVYDWKSQNNSFIEALEVEQMVMFFILALVIMIAAFNIISSLVMLVESKGKNIALMVAMGMTKMSVLKIFIFMGSIIGILGSILGAVLGWVLSSNIDSIQSFLENSLDKSLFDPVVYFLSKIPSEFNLNHTILIVLFSSVVAILSSLYPAIKAIKFQPADALRYE